MQIHSSTAILKFAYFSAAETCYAGRGSPLFQRGAGNLERDFLIRKSGYSTAVLSWATIRTHTPKDRIKIRLCNINYS